MSFANRTGLALLGLLLLTGGAMAQPPVEPATVQGSVHSITLPNYNPEMPAGKHLQLFNNNCTVCHSARYVLMQPPLAASVWTAEVRKMHKVFGCPLKEADIQPLVDYLTTQQTPESHH